MKVSKNEMRLREEEIELKNQILMVEKSLPKNYYFSESLAPWVFAFFIIFLVVVGFYINIEYLNEEFYYFLLFLILVMAPVIYDGSNCNLLVISFTDYVIKLGMTIAKYLFGKYIYFSHKEKLLILGVPKEKYLIEKEELSSLYSVLNPITEKLNNINRSRKEYNYYLYFREKVKSKYTLSHLDILLENLENNRYTFNIRYISIFHDDVNKFDFWWKNEIYWKYTHNNNILKSQQDNKSIREFVNHEIKAKSRRITTSRSRSVGSKKNNLHLIDNGNKILPLPSLKPDIQRSQKFDTVQHIKNIEIGELGELFVIEQEKKRLVSAGRSDLAQKIIHISKEFGDSAGYDILSYNINGDEKMIEVKTTAGNISDDFFLTENEYRSMNINDNYYIYRVFNYGKEENTGQIKEIHCLSDKNQLNINISSYFVKPNILKSN